MNGGDNIATYLQLFSQVKGPEIAVYVVVCYIFLGVWCLIAYLVMMGKHIVSLAQKYARLVMPLLHVGLGVFIIESSCYPWSTTSGNPGQTITVIITMGVLLVCMDAAMLWFKL